jgi:hypothetical protein
MLKEIRHFCFVIILSFTYSSSNCSCKSATDANQILDNKKEFVYIFAHGLGMNSKHVWAYKASGVIPKGCTVLSKDGPEVAKGLQYSSLGQEKDINIIIDQIEEACKQNKDCKIIGVGVSKGAATWVNTIGTLAKQKSHYLKNIKALVIESSFTRVQDVAVNSIPKYLQSACPACVINAILNWKYPNFDTHGSQPIESITQWDGLDKQTVIVFVHSHRDKFIPFEQTKMLFDAASQLEFKNLYLIEAFGGGHANVVCGPDGQKVCSELCAIYKKHGLPISDM